MQDIHAWRKPVAPLGVRAPAPGGAAASSSGDGAKASETFYKTRRLGSDELLPDGFRDAGGSRDPREGPSTSAATSVLLVDRSVDRRLSELVESTVKKLGKGSDSATKVMAAALLVSEVLGRSTADVAAMERASEGLVLESLATDGTVMMGDILANREKRQQGAGGARHRAVLLKAYCDWLGLAPCALCRDAAGCTWNTVTIDGVNYVVDVVLDPGAMYEEDSARATEYTSRLKQVRPSKAAAPSLADNLQGRMARPPWHVEPWEVEFSRGDRAGRGGFGEVFRGRWAGQSVAVKEVKDTSPTDGDVCEFVLEISLLSGLSHPNIVRFWRGCVDMRRGSRTLLLVTEFMDRGILSDLLHGETPGPELDEGQSWVICQGTARGIGYLHQVGVLHLDLKSPNVLLNSHFQCKLCDFGLSKVTEHVGAHTTLKGVSPVWAPPEMFDDSVGHISEKADVYSFGIIVFEVFTKSVPYAEVGQMHLTRIKSKGQLPTFPPDLAPDVVEFARACLAHRPGDRISVQGALKQIQSIGKQRGLDLQKVKDQMEAQGFNTGGSPEKGDLMQQAQAESKIVEAEIARIKKALKAEEESMLAIELEIKQKSFDGTSAGGGNRKLEMFCQSNCERLDDMKFRCKLCMKLFRGEEFTIKHIKDKHFSDMLMGMTPLAAGNGGGDAPKKQNSDAFFDTDVGGDAGIKALVATDARKVDALQDAARNGEMMKLQQAVRQGGAAALNSTDPDGCTLLHLGTSGGHAEVVRFLLANSVGTSPKNDNGVAALHIAAQEGYTDVCELLLQGGVPCDIPDDLKMRTPLHFAASNAHMDACSALLAKKASPDTRDSDGGSALHHAARSGSSEVCELILSWGALVNGKDNDGWRPLHEAVRWGDGELVQVLLQRGADLHATSNEGESPLHVVPGGYAEVEVVDVLLQAKANLNSADLGGETPLHVAVKLGDDNFVSFMLNNGADANYKSRSGSTPLDLAKKDEIRWLLRSHKAKKGTGAT